MTHKFSRIPTGVGDVAATTTTDSNFVEELWGALQNEHALDSLLSSGDGGHKSSGATTNHHQIPAVRCFRLRGGRRGRLRCCSNAFQLVGVRH
jgi:hypothetical protein